MRKMNIKTVVSLLVVVTACTYVAYACPSFPDDCRTECITADNNGCLVCNCIYLVNEGNNHPAGILGDGCPVSPDGCLPSCISMDDKGCLVCTCANAVHITKPTTTATAKLWTILEPLCPFGNTLRPCNQHSG